LKSNFIEIGFIYVKCKVTAVANVLGLLVTRTAGHGSDAEEGNAQHE
jgi:hypothetical protein